VACDSRKVQLQALFFALQGAKEDGAKFARDAVSRGAVAVLVKQLRLRLSVERRVDSSSRRAQSSCNRCREFLWPSRECAEARRRHGTNAKPHDFAD